MTYRSKLTNASLLALACVLAPASGASAQETKTPTTKSGFVTTPDGINIHYIEAGQAKTMGTFRIGGGPPKSGDVAAGSVAISDIKQEPAILFVPGWTMPAEIWENQIAYFAKTHRVVAMDPAVRGNLRRPPRAFTRPRGRGTSKPLWTS